jgi:hypothetical protein
MYARGQLDKAMFLAARDYERIYATAMALPVKTIDPSAPVVSGGSGTADLVDAVKDAADRLARMEGRLRKQYVAEAVTLVREVLGDGLTVERAARKRGDADKDLAIKWWGGMLRRSLQELCPLPVRWLGLDVGLQGFHHDPPRDLAAGVVERFEGCRHADLVRVGKPHLRGDGRRDADLDQRRTDRLHRPAGGRGSADAGVLAPHGLRRLGVGQGMPCRRKARDR